MHLMNIIYVSDMKKSVAFYESLGLTRDDSGPIDDWWNQFSLGDAVIALHWGGDRPIPQPSKHLEVPLQVPGEASLEDLRGADAMTSRTAGDRRRTETGAP